MYVMQCASMMLLKGRGGVATIFNNVVKWQKTFIVPQGRGLRWPW